MWYVSKEELELMEFDFLEGEIKKKLVLSDEDANHLLDIARSNLYNDEAPRVLQIPSVHDYKVYYYIEFRSGIIEFC